MKDLGRKAMQMLYDFDRGYAERLPEGPTQVGDLLGITPIEDFIRMEQVGKTPSQKVMLGAYKVAGVGSNLGVRYALPLGGLTLAGKALYDLTQDYQTSGTLRPY